jgi:metal-responsive CopG/Arc/MetJ family transcriptional regulator
MQLLREQCRTACIAIIVVNGDTERSRVLREHIAEGQLELADFKQLSTARGLYTSDK